MPLIQLNPIVQFVDLLVKHNWAEDQTATSGPFVYIKDTKAIHFPDTLTKDILEFSLHRNNNLLMFADHTTDNKLIIDFIEN